MRAALLAVLLLAGCATPAALETAGEAQAPAPRYDTSWDYSRTLLPGSLALLPPEVVKVPSPAGGSGVQVAVVRPDVAGPVPVIAIASPYYPPLVADKIARDDFDATTDYAQGMYILFAKRFAPHGYAVALVAVRGTSGSGGCMDFNGAAERGDVDAAVTWLGGQPWSNGNVGMVGGSYDGTTQWEAAASGNPHLKTIVPIAAVNDLFSLLYPNGTLDGRGAGGSLVSYWHSGFVESNPANGRSPADVADAVVCPPTWSGLSPHVQASLTGVRDAWWAERNSRPGVESSYRGTVFLVHGYQDRVVNPQQAHPWAATLQAQGALVKQWLGQWPHAWPDMPGLPEGTRRWDWAETLLRWFDRWLKEDATVDIGPLVESQDSAGAWRAGDAWPPSDARPRALFLAPGGRLEDGASGARAGLLLCAQPLDDLTEPVAPGPACLARRFESAPFPDGFRFAGLPTLHVAATPHAPGGGLVARLYVIAEGEAAQLVGRAQIDLRFASGGETPQAVAPGERIVARMQLDPLDVAVPPGGRLALVLTEGALEERMPPAIGGPIDIEVGGDASALTMLAFDR